MEQDYEIISGDETDILQEIMNIAFGKAAADLAELINIFLVLSVPEIKVLHAVQLPEYIAAEIADYGRISMVEQHFWGNFKGSAFLIFPSGAGRELVALLGEKDISLFDTFSADVLEKETMMEVGNILIGACVGKVTELLKDFVTYSPPRVVIANHPNDAIPTGIFDPDSSATVLRTVFTFNDRDVNGFLFLITSHDSISWLKKALAEFMAQYE